MGPAVDGRPAPASGPERPEPGQVRRAAVTIAERCSSELSLSAAWFGISDYSLHLFVPPGICFSYQQHHVRFPQKHIQSHK